MKRKEAFNKEEEMRMIELYADGCNYRELKKGTNAHNA